MSCMLRANCSLPQYNNAGIMAHQNSSESHTIASEYSMPLLMKVMTLDMYS